MNKLLVGSYKGMIMEVKMSNLLPCTVTQMNLTDIMLSEKPDRKTFLLHDPQSEHLLLVNLDLLTELIDLFRGIQEPAELAVGDHNRIIRLLRHQPSMAAQPVRRPF